MSPVKGSDLARQIELARESIERWPQWLKDASGIGKESVEGAPGERQAIAPKIPLSTGDFID